MNFCILLILVKSANGEIHNAYNLSIIKNTVTIVPRGNFNDNSVEEILKTAYYKSKDQCKSLKTDWLKIYRTQVRTSNPVENPR